MALVLVALAGWSAAAAHAKPEAVVWAVGAGGDGSNEARALSAVIEADHPDAFLYLGDVYPEGTAVDFAERYQTVYGALKPITWPTPGNHDWTNRFKGYFPYWGARVARRGWYRVRIAGWDVLSLNSEARHDARSPQLRWLKGVLARSSGTCRLAFWHRERYSVGTVHGGSADVAPLWNALRRRARLVVNSHDHVMLRYLLRDGLTELVSGAGGDTLYATRPSSQVVFTGTGIQGALRLVLARGRATVEFRSVTGQVLDRSTAHCRPLTPAVGRRR
jgi:hypothetical protein